MNVNRFSFFCTLWIFPNVNFAFTLLPLHKFILSLLLGGYLGLRKRGLSLDLDSYRTPSECDEPITIAVDLTGVKAHRTGSWVMRPERRWGLRSAVGCGDSVLDV